MESSDVLVGWSKKVLCERDDGVHEWLDALYCCRTLVEAITLQSCHSPTHLKRGWEVLMSHGNCVYGSESGHLYVVFDWRSREAFVQQDRFAEV
ncbi:hypothetical protein GN316_10910 [Xylophilus sp. Kf1]|nr:hypothetical protein [Xylophilus sp. Kf1]